MQKLIKDFQKGERVEGFYFIKKLNLKTSSNNNKYLDIVLSDTSAEIDSKLWSVEKQQEDLYKVGDVVKVRADITLWQDNFQLKILKIRQVEKTDNINYDLIIPSAPIKAEVMLDFIKKEVEDIKNKDLKAITKALIEKREEKLLYYPAAKANHHSIKAGLLYHYYRMINLAKAICVIYEADYDLLLSGIIFHDIEKITEMEAGVHGAVSKYSKEGMLLGHIISGVVEVETLSKELNTDPEIVLLLKHMILSHHYYPEYGSPKKPMFLEAELLHHIDMIDARVYDFNKVESTIEEGEFSEPIFTLDRRRVYKRIK